jgi:cytochrome c peroxidase
MSKTRRGTTAIRRFLGGAALLTGSVVAASIGASSRHVARDAASPELTFENSSGALGSVNTRGTFDRDNPFFRELGSNGRTCETCHRPAQAWTITPAEIQDRFERTSGRDPIFRTNDGSNCPGADISTVQRRREAFTLLLTKGLIRVALDVPAGAEFAIVDVDDPYRCGGSLTTLSLYRRPLPTTNLAFLSAVMWDGRATVPRRGIKEDLVAQALDATIGHAQAPFASEAQLREIVAFESGLFTAQTIDRGAGSLRAGGARGGPDVLARQPFCIGINDPFGTLPSTPGACLAASKGLDHAVFTQFGAWAIDDWPERQAIARGEAIFNTRRFVIDNVPGLNGASQDPLPGPMPNGTCSVCHDTPGAGNHSVPMPLNIGIAAASRRTPDLPLYMLRNGITGELIATTDPGRAMVTGRWNDIGKFKGPVLRALAARAPYFHDGSAASLSDVIDFYNVRFKIELSDAEKADLLAFLRAL